MREFFVVWAPKWSLGVSHGQDMSCCERMDHSKRLPNSQFKVLMNEAGGLCASLQAQN